ncbi:MAG: hypothetical protein AAF153_00010 [Pseudomonadota bacterium]
MNKQETYKNSQQNANKTFFIEKIILRFTIFYGCLTLLLPELAIAASNPGNGISGVTDVKSVADEISNFVQGPTMKTVLNVGGAASVFTSVFTQRMAPFIVGVGILAFSYIYFGIVNGNTLFLK